MSFRHPFGRSTSLYVSLLEVPKAQVPSSSPSQQGTRLPFTVNWSGGFGLAFVTEPRPL